MITPASALPTLAPAPPKESFTPQAENGGEHGGEDSRNDDRENKTTRTGTEPKEFPLKFCTVCASNQNRYVHLCIVDMNLFAMACSMLCPRIAFLLLFVML